MTVLWKYFNVGTWLLAVTAFCIEVIIKVMITITIYILFMWDSHCQDGLWESLDDWVYYIRASGNVVEFCFAVFLFFNGGWILLFESGGTIRACMMLIHAYFNIWCEARNGWSAFTKRRTAVAKINSLNDATEDEIEKHNDVCAICYQEMTVAKLTRCRHMFHSICLRKWLYMQVINDMRVLNSLILFSISCRTTAPCVMRSCIGVMPRHKQKRRSWTLLDSRLQSPLRWRLEPSTMKKTIPPSLQNLPMMTRIRR